MTDETKNVMTYNLQQFRNLLDLLASCNDEHRVKLTPEGLIIKTVDPANVFMQVLEIPEDAFNEYNVTEEIVLGLPVQAILGKLRTAFYKDVDLGETFSITHIDEGPKDTLIHCNAGPLMFTVKALDPNNIRAEPRVPALDLPYEYMTSTNELYAALLLSDGEHATIDKTTISQDTHPKECEPGCILQNKYTFEHPAIIKDEGPATSKFSRDYAFDFITPLRDIADDVKISIGCDYPLMFSAVGHSGEKISLLLAPRIESD